MQDEQLEPGLSFQQLRENLGSLMFVWCRLEDALAEALQAANDRGLGKVSGSFYERIIALGDYLEARFRYDEPLTAELANLMERIDHVRRQRNLIIHGLAGISSDPKKGEPHITCNQGDYRSGSAVKITLQELANLLAAIDRCQVDLAHLALLSRRRRRPG